MRFWAVFVFSAVLVSGCSIKPRYEAPAPVVNGSTGASVTTPATSPAPVSRQEGQVEITPLQEPPAPQAVNTASLSSAPVSSVPQPAQNRAVELLQERAADQVAKGDYANAAKSLERALSIEPNNARTWNLLAHLREQQKQYATAAEIAARSNSLLSAGQTAMQKDNWLLISRVKKHTGDLAGAEHAKKQASLLN